MLTQQGFTKPNPSLQAEKAESLYQRACAELLANRGPFAMPLLLECQRLDPSHYLCTRLLSGYFMKNGLYVEGREMMEDFYLRHPYRTTGQEFVGSKPELLLVRGFSRSRIFPRVNSSGEIATTFRGGIFSTEYLLLEPDYPIHHYTIAAGNILRPNDVPDHTLILNTIADSDVEAETLSTLAAYLIAQPKRPIINHPDNVLKLTRDQNYQRLHGWPGVRFPKTHRIQLDGADAAKLATIIDEFGFGNEPVILKKTGAHTSHSVPLFRVRKDLERFIEPAGLTGEYYLIQYVEELWKERYFRKLRLFCIDGTFYPVVCHLDLHWNVHGGNRKEVMLKDESLMDEERRFLFDWAGYVGAANVERLEQISGLVGLEFFGIDFTIDSEGNLLIYELNPAMRHSFERSEDFPYKLPFDQEISRAFSKMIDNRLTVYGVGPD